MVVVLFDFNQADTTSATKTYVDERDINKPRCLSH